MNLSNSAYELAEARSQQERQAGIEIASKAVAKTGLCICQDCGSMIAAARQQAAPFARRCIDCQTAFEHERLSR